MFRGASQEEGLLRGLAISRLELFYELGLIKRILELSVYICSLLTDIH